VLTPAFANKDLASSRESLELGDPSTSGRRCWAQGNWMDPGIRIDRLVRLPIQPRVSRPSNCAQLQASLTLGDRDVASSLLAGSLVSRSPLGRQGRRSEAPVPKVALRGQFAPPRPAFASRSLDRRHGRGKSASASHRHPPAGVKSPDSTMSLVPQLRLRALGSPHREIAPHTHWPSRSGVLHPKSFRLWDQMSFCRSIW
jgi:hypothetical protein